MMTVTPSRVSKFSFTEYDNGYRVYKNSLSNTNTVHLLLFIKNKYLIINKKSDLRPMFLFIIDLSLNNNYMRACIYRPVSNVHITVTRRTTSVLGDPASLSSIWRFTWNWKSRIPISL